jgi:translation initiation factor IF-2
LAKNLKLNIKNAQIAEAINLSGLKGKLAKKKEEQEAVSKTSAIPSKIEGEEVPKEEAPRIKARSKSAFAEPSFEAGVKEPFEQEVETPAEEPSKKEQVNPSPFLFEEEEVKRMKTSAELRQEIFGDVPEPPMTSKEAVSFLQQEVTFKPIAEEKPLQEPKVVKPAAKEFITPAPRGAREVPPFAERDKLGPTGRHIKDYLRPKTPPPPTKAPIAEQKAEVKEVGADGKEKFKGKPKPATAAAPQTEEAKGGVKSSKFKEFRDIKPAKRPAQSTKQFDARDRQGLRASDDDQQWRRRRKSQARYQQEDVTIRPTSLKVRIPISVKDLASEMKLKASQLVGKLFLQGVILTLNDLLEDETTIQLLGQDFGCEITIDTSEAERIQITDKSIKEELAETPPEQLQLRPPIVAFMGHVDHGKTSLIDAIRKSNRAAGEAGAITQHIGAFKVKTAVGDLAILDTPGHEAFSAMRARGADVTDIVVLVVAGDEGIRQQTIEAIQHAKAAHVVIVVAINKCDKPNFNPETVYRQLAEQELLPEAWGGQTITVNCSAVTGEGIPQLLDMLALQSEVLELRADPNKRARGSVLESEMHKGLGSVATVLVMNGTLHRGDALVFGQLWGRIKTMHDEFGRELEEAGPSTPVEITGLSGLPEAGQQFIVVKSEKEARDIAEARFEGVKQSNLLLQQKKKISMESILQQAATTGKKMLNIVLRADVQGSLEALKAALMKIESERADLTIIFAGIGEVSESDINLAAASKAVVLGFHTQIESHAEPLVKQLGVQVRMHNIIYHAIDDVKLLMTGLLDKIAQETEKGKAEVKAVFKSSHTGMIAGCQVSEGVIQRNNTIRLRRNNEVIWTGSIASLKRVKEDVREVLKGFECGILLNNFSEIREGDILEAFEITYIAQEL